MQTDSIFDNNEITFSIIIPHFNIPKELDRLLSTIPDEKCVQVIVVDDRSDKNIVELNKLYEVWKIRNVEFYSNDGIKGAGACRNIGLKHAVGRWVLFADADDWFTENFYGVICSYCDYDCDMVIFCAESRFADGTAAPRDRIYTKLVKDYISNRNQYNELRLRYKEVTPCFKMIRRDMIIKYGISFEEIMYSNDSMFSTMCGFYAKRLEVSEEVIYCISDRAESLTKKKDTAVLDMRTAAFIRRMKFLRKHLTKEEWKMMNVSGTIKLSLALQNGYGIKKVIQMAMLFQINGIHPVDLSMVNLKTAPKTFFNILKKSRR